MITGVVGIAEGYSQTKAQWFLKKNSAEIAYLEATRNLPVDSRANCTKTRWGIHTTYYPIRRKGIATNRECQGIDLIQITRPFIDVTGGWWLVWDQTQRLVRLSAVSTVTLINSVTEWCLASSTLSHDLEWTEQELKDAIDHIRRGQATFLNAQNNPVYLWPIPRFI